MSKSPRAKVLSQAEIEGFRNSMVTPGECCPFCSAWTIVTLPHTAVDWCGTCGTAWIYMIDGERFVYRPSVARVSTLARVRNFVVSWFRR